MTNESVRLGIGTENVTNESGHGMSSGRWGPRPGWHVVVAAAATSTVVRMREERISRLPEVEVWGSKGREWAGGEGDALVAVEATTYGVRSSTEEVLSSRC